MGCVERGGERRGSLREACILYLTLASYLLCKEPCEKRKVLNIKLGLSEVDGVGQLGLRSNP